MHWLDKWYIFKKGAELRDNLNYKRIERNKIAYRINQYNNRQVMPYLPYIG